MGSKKGAAYSSLGPTKVLYATSLALIGAKAQVPAKKTLNLSFMYLPLFVGVLCWSLFGMHYFMSFQFCNHLDGEERAYCLLDVLLL